MSFASELWEVQGDPKYEEKIEEMLYERGIKYISMPQASGCRGGGAAIVSTLTNFSLDKIDIMMCLGFIKTKISLKVI